MNIDVKNIDGSVVFSVITDENSVYNQELMKSDYVKLSWESDEDIALPAGTYIEYDGERYKLLDNYKPSQNDECSYNYTPQFQSRVMNWDKQVTPVYTYEEDGSTVKGKELDWEFTGSPADAMYIIKQAIKNETGEEWNVEISEGLPATISISSQSSSIFGMLNTISSECNTEWWADKKTNTLYLSKCIFGEPITLEVGKNVNIPSVNNDSEGYFTRFYAFGSTRNITQDYNSGQATNHIVNKRLTLNPTKYPNGYKDIKEGLKQEEVFVKVLYFDDIYPSSKLSISDVRARLKYRLDTDGNRIKIGGTEEDPIYEQYAIWYFQIAGFTFDPEDIIEGLNLSVSFQSGQLAQREFELKYHDKAETVNDENDVTAFNVKAGDYEIIINETSGNIIPGTSYIIPQEGDSIILFNIKIPDEYVTSAQDELEKELDKAMLSYTEDNNTYQFQSDPTIFYQQDTNILLGQAVTFVNGKNSLSTRVQMIEKRLDLSCYQTIKVGNKIIKGNTQQLKDEVANVNQNIDVIKAFNDLSASLSQSYANAQREMIEGFAAIKNLWTLETDENGEKYAYTQYNVLTRGGVTQYSKPNNKVPSIFDGLPLDNKTIWKNPESGLIEVIGGTGGDFDINAMWSALASSSDNQINKSHLTNALTGYATEEWVTSKNYATTEALNSVSNKLNDFLEGSDTDSIINKWKELEAFLSGMAETDNLAEILKTKADRSYVDSTFVTLATKQTITGEKTFSSVLNTAAIKASGAITTPSLAASDYVTIAGIKLRKLEDGALMLEGNLALTGALTMYASNGQSFDTIYDGLPIDNDTIYWQEVEGSKVLKAKEGSGSSFDKSAMWNALAGETTEQINKSHLTTALTGYATESWVSGKNYAVKATTLAGYGITDGINAVSVTGTGNAVTAASISGHILTLTKGSTFSLSGHKHAWTDITSGKPSTLSGYGITDAYTKTDADSRYVNVSGDTMTGLLTLGASSGIKGTSSSNMQIGLYTPQNIYLQTPGILYYSPKAGTNHKIWHAGNDGHGSGLDADLLDGIHANGLLTALSTSSATNLSITVGGTTKKITDLYAYASTKLETARSLWGNNFDGTASISGTIQFVSDKERWLLQTRRSDNTQINGIKTDGFQMCTYFGDTKTMQFKSDKIYSYVDFRAEKDLYINGIRLHKTSDGVITLEGNLAVTGGVTMYAIDPVSASTIMDGVVVDGTTIAKVDGVLKVLNAGGGEAGSVAWGNISGKPSVFATNIANITDLHSSWDAVLAAQKPAWLTAVSIATISDLNSGWDALLKAAPSAYVTRWPTISEVTNKQNLVVKLNGGTTEGTNQFTYNATAAKSINITASSVGAAASSHNHSWSNITSGKPSNLAGYGITDGVNSVSVTGTGNAITSASISGHSLTLTKGSTFLLSSQYTAADILAKLKTVDGGGSDLEADILAITGETGSMTGADLPAHTGMQVFQYYLSGNGPANYGNVLRIRGTGDGCGELFLEWVGTNNTGNIWYKSKRDVGFWGSWRQVAFTDMNVASATRLQTARNIWGQSFDGTANVTGIITAYNGINLPYRQQIQTEYGTLVATGYNSESGYNDFFQLTAVGANKIARSLVGGNTGKLVWEGHNFIMTTYGGGWYMSDSEWMRTYNNKGVVCNDLWIDSRVRFGGNAEFGGNYSPNGVVFYDKTRTQRGIFSWYNDHFYMAKFENNKESTGYVAIYEDYVAVGGDLLVTGGCTFYGSDIRYKSIMQQVNLSLLDIAKAPSFVYRWNRPNMNQNRLNLGGSAQYTQTILPWAVEDNSNFLSMDYATVAYTFAVHTARHLLTYESRTDKKIKKLENRVKYLEKQLKKLGYEEASIVDDSSI